VLQWLGSEFELWGLYILAFSFSMLALNVIYTAMIGLVPDLIHPDQSGSANGAIATLSSLGAVTGYEVWSLVGGDTRLMYWYYLGNLVVAITVSVCAIQEEPLVVMANEVDIELAVGDMVVYDKGEVVSKATIAAVHRDDIEVYYTISFPNGHEKQTTSDHLQAPQMPVEWADIQGSFWISPSLHPDFFMVFVSRTFYYMGISSMAFFLYYLKDMIHAPDPESAVSFVSMMGLACAASTAYPAGMLSDYFGNRRKIYIYVANIIMAAGSVGLAFADSMTTVYVLICIIGACEGCYLTMDYAIAMDTIPNAEEAARFMGVWGVAAFLGTALGPLINGPLLFVVGQTDVSGEFSRPGYAVLWFSSAIYLLTGAYLIRYVKSVK